LKICQAHPRRGSSYSVSDNNCQHFVATFLVFLEAFAKSTPGRSFQVKEPRRYHKILKVVGGLSTGDAYNVPNVASEMISRLVMDPIGAMGLAVMHPEFAALSKKFSQTFKNPLPIPYGFPQTSPPLDEKELEPEPQEGYSSSHPSNGCLSSSSESNSSIKLYMLEE